MPKSYTVVDDYHDLRLDRWFKQNVIDLPHSLIEKIIRQNKIKVNKKKTKSSYRLQTGDLIEIYDISKFKPVDKKEKIKYLPKKKEIGDYDDYVEETTEQKQLANNPQDKYQQIRFDRRNLFYYLDTDGYIVLQVNGTHSYSEPV